MTSEYLFTVESPLVIHLVAADSRLGALIGAIGDLRLDLRTDYFWALARSIVGQQLSPRAAQTIWSRFEAKCDPVTPETVISLSPDVLRGVGLSGRKASYVTGLSRAVLDGGLDLDELPQLPDEDVIRKLTAIKGIGRWTAEMFLIFSLGRLDVLSVDDVGLQRAIDWLYELKGRPGRDSLETLGARWKPYRTVASLYLWEAVNLGWINGPLPGSAV